MVRKAVKMIKPVANSAGFLLMGVALLALMASFGHCRRQVMPFVFFFIFWTPAAFLAAADILLTLNPKKFAALKKIFIR